MSTKVMVTINVKRDGGEWSVGKTLTLSGKDDLGAKLYWENEFGRFLNLALKGIPDVVDEEEEPTQE